MTVLVLPPELVRPATAGASVVTLAGEPFSPADAGEPTAIQRMLAERLALTGEMDRANAKADSLTGIARDQQEAVCNDIHRQQAELELAIVEAMPTCAADHRVQLAIVAHWVTWGEPSCICDRIAAYQTEGIAG